MPIAVRQAEVALRGNVEITVRNEVDEG